MHFVVGPLRPQGVLSTGNSFEIIDKLAKQCVKLYDTDKDEAIRRAEQLARENPGVQFALFVPVKIFETVQQPAPPLIRKKFNENGEIVLDKGDQ